MSLIYLVLLLIATITVSITGALFSISGLATLFGGAAFSVAVMAGALELSKFIVVGFIYRYWGHIHGPLRSYLIFSVVVLMVITSIGIFGYLSHAYQIASGDLHARLIEIESLENENRRIQDQIKEIRGFIDNIPDSRISRKFEFQKEYDPQLRELRAQSDRTLKQVDQKKLEMLGVHTKAGPIVYLAKSLNTDIDTVVKWLILLFVSVFDPLAVSLVFCLNLLVRLREKYRRNEYKIGAYSLTTPVDHRLSQRKERDSKRSRKSKRAPRTASPVRRLSSYRFKKTG